jgi:hypothetical protein
MEKRIVAYIQFNRNLGWNDESASKWLLERHFRTRYYNRRHPDYSGYFINYFQTSLKRVKRNLTSVKLNNGVTLYFGVRKPRNCVKNTDILNVE